MLSSRPVNLGMDAHVYPAKTPGKMKGRTENMIHPMTVHGKAKETVLRTPFHPAGKDLNKPQNGATNPDQLKSNITLTTVRSSRPLGDKTPFPNRARQQHATQFQTPISQLAKLQSHDGTPTFEKPALGTTPDALLRPSSTRRHLRVPRSVSRSFETPVNRGNHWDVSDGSIEVQESQALEETVEEVEDFDEIEYMPPNTLDLPYQPPFEFELPDYKEVGKKLLEIVHSYPYDDTPFPEIHIDETDIQFVDWDMFSLPELEDEYDPFYEPKPAQPTQTKVPTLPIRASQRLAEKAKAKTEDLTAKQVPNAKPAAIRAATTTRTTAATARSAAVQTTTTSRPGTALSTARKTDGGVGLKAASSSRSQSKAEADVPAPKSRIRPPTLTRSDTTSGVRERRVLTRTTTTTQPSRTATAKPTNLASSEKQVVGVSASRLPSRSTRSTKTSSKKPAELEDGLIVGLKEFGDIPLVDDFLFDV